MTITHTSIAGALALNVPTIVAAAFLPASTIVVMAVCLALIGAALGAIVYVGFPAATEHKLIELPVSRDDHRAAA
jgi:hypothetical protein